MDELNNALAWFKAAPANFYKSGKEKLEGTAQWIWEVIQGDFNEDQSTAQVVTGTVISMIPFVDQICDVRDVVANCKKINQDSSNKWHWVALVFTLIGLIPTLGSVIKGGFKLLFAYGRKAALNASKAALDADFWRASKPFVEAGLVKFDQFLNDPKVRKALKALKWDNPYKHFAIKIRELAAQVTVAKLLKEFDTVIDALKSFVRLIDKWGSAAMKTQAGQLLQNVQRIRDQAGAEIGKVLRPVQDWLERLARRLEVEADLRYRADTNSVNPHHYTATRLNADTEEAALNAKKEPWADVAKGFKHKPLIERDLPALQKDFDSKVAQGWTSPVTGKGRNRDPMENAYQTFHSIKGVEIPPGEMLYRVLDPSSADNSICWMRKAEYEALKSKDDWRRRFAVWKHWNSNGEVVTYTVPPGKTLKVWEGVTASQRLSENSKYFLEGGAKQLVIEPTDLAKEYMGKRQLTGWGTSDGMTREVDFTGLPVVTHNWRNY